MPPSALSLKVTSARLSSVPSGRKQVSRVAIRYLQRSHRSGSCLIDGMLAALHGCKKRVRIPWRGDPPACLPQLDSLLLTREEVEEQERLVDRWAGRNPGMVDQSDAAIARERLKIVRRSIERYGKPW